MKLSIIIPVYKVEKYIGAALQSLVEQQQNAIEYEIIVVDDGTPDNSMQIVDTYKDKLPISIIHQENRGLSGARNTGLRHAKGKYVWFVDSDDTIADGILKELGELLPKENADVIGFDVNVFLDGVFLRRERPYCKRKYYKYDSLRLNSAKAGLCIGTGLAQRFLFRRDFCFSNNLFFLEGVIFEDLEYLVRVRCLANHVAIYNIVNYNYLKRSSESIMSTLDMRSIHSRILIRQNWEIFSHKFPQFNWKRALINNHCFSITCRVLSQQSSVKNPEYSFFYKENRWLQTRKGIRFFCRAWGYHSIKDYLRLVFLIAAPKLNSRL